MWDSKKFSEILKGLRGKEWMGEVITTKDQIYEIISDQLESEVYPETIKKWQGPNSKGPRNNEMIEKLEKILELPSGSLGKKEEKNMTKPSIKVTTGLTDFSKNAVFNCYSLMKDYLLGDEVESEDAFCKMDAEIDKYKICIPVHIFNSIKDFINERIAPIVYDPDTVFKNCYTDDIGTYDEESETFVIKDEEGTMKMMMYFMDAIIEIEKDLDNFAMETLFPLLVA